jgi:hypothetical protein
MAAYLLVCTAVALRRGMWMSLPFLWLFLQGHAYLFFLSLSARPRTRARPAAA